MKDVDANPKALGKRSELEKGRSSVMEFKMARTSNSKEKKIKESWKKGCDTNPGGGKHSMRDCLSEESDGHKLTTYYLCIP